MRKRILLCALLCAMLAGCDSDAEPTVTQPTVTQIEISTESFTREMIRFTEMKTDMTGLGAFGLNKDMDITIIDGNTFAFDPKISMEERVSCIQATREIILETGLERTVKVYIYKPDTYDTMFVESGSVYTSVQDWHSQAYIVGVLQGLFGEFCNYGAVYGYASCIAESIYGAQLPQCEEVGEYSGNPDALDLNLLCFDPAFVTEQEVAWAKELAIAFVQDYISDNGIEQFHILLESSGTLDGAESFCQVLREFYAEKGITYDPSGVLFSAGGRTFDYIVQGVGVKLHVEKNWTDMNHELSPLTDEQFLHKDYSSVKHYFTTTLQEMRQYRELFGLEESKDDLKIYFTNVLGNSSGYNASVHVIVLQNTGSMSHEYIHALTYTANIQQVWAMEGFAHWYDAYYNHYGNAMSSVDFNSADRPYILEFKEKMGRDIDFAEDFREIWHITSYAFSYDDPNDGGGYVPGASFIGYLISRFGEKKVIEMICVTHDFGEFTYEELVTDWQQFIQENYSGYTKYKTK